MTKPILFDVGENARSLFVWRAIRIRPEVNATAIDIIPSREFRVISRYLIPVRAFIRKVRHGILALRDLIVSGLPEHGALLPGVHATELNEHAIIYELFQDPREVRASAFLLELIETE